MIVERVITIEYLEPSMSQQLLNKFPDHSAFDFDYSQSGIWSPLLPRGGGAQTTLFDVSPSEIRRKLLQDSVEYSQKKFKKVSSKIKKKIAKATSSKKKTNTRGLDFSSVSPVKSSSSKKVWAKVLKAASKKFKKQKVAPSLRLQNFLNLGEF